ncbi:hypothetical protein [Hyphomonas sp.]|uniref:hypothetical protein n=1 Tax=Hyphomonas sp. TaxID=87 RepID=UPI00391DE220
MRKLMASSLLALWPIMLPVHADEAWSTPIGEVIYEADLPDGRAVFSFPGEGGARLIAIFDGLAGVTSGRGYHAGVWVDPDAGTEGPCPAAMVDPLSGRTSHAWGQMDLIFTEPDSPGGWVALRGSCFDAATDYLIGTPLTE